MFKNGKTDYTEMPRDDSTDHLKIWKVNIKFKRTNYFRLRYFAKKCLGDCPTNEFRTIESQNLERQNLKNLKTL